MRARLIVIVATLTATAALASTPDEAIRRQVAPLVDNGLVPGLVVGVIEDGEARVLGFGSLAPRDHRTPDGSTVYEIGSISKVFTGVLLADASLRGEVALEDTLEQFMPKGMEPPSSEGAVPTLTHLATHMASLSRLPDNIDSLDAKNPYAGYGSDDLWAYLNGRWLPVPPGSSYVYSNLGMGLLGTILAERAGATYEGLVRERIAKPLGMRDTTLALTDDQRDRLATGTIGGAMAVQNWDFDALAGCGAIRSTADDMLLLLQGALNPPDNEIGRALALSMERRATLPKSVGGDPEAGTGAGLGLGWHIAADGVIRWHNGQTGGYKSFMGIHSEKRVGVVVLANGADPQVDVVADQILALLLGVEQEPIDVRPAVKIADADIEPLVGSFFSPAGFVIEITHEPDIDGQGHGAVYAKLTNQPALRLWAESPTEFFYREVPATVTFTPDEEGTPASILTLKQSGRTFECKRMEKPEK